MTRSFAWLKAFNEGLAILAGGLFLLSVLVTVFDIVARQLGHSLGGTDELSGYAMAIATSWGMSYTLTNLAHVRIDLLRSRCRSMGQSLFDTIAILSLAATAAVVAYRVWPVLEKSIKNSSTANTTLETPLWIPQSLWMAGWFWFAFSAFSMAVLVVYWVLKGDFESVNEHAGIRDET